jgi:hypothetical protein
VRERSIGELQSTSMASTGNVRRTRERTAKECTYPSWSVASSGRRRHGSGARHLHPRDQTADRSDVSRKPNHVKLLKGIKRHNEDDRGPT